MRTSHALVTEHRPFVRASLRNMGVCGPTLEDAEQEVFLVLVRRWGDFDPSRGTSERGWIWGICRNVAFAHRRSSLRRGKFEPLGEMCDRPPVEERITATQALSSLDRDSRALWIARCEGRTARELADSLDLPLTTVQWRLRQAQRSIRSMLRGLAHTGHALVTWLLRPQHGFVHAFAPAIATLVLVPAPPQTLDAPAESARPRVAAPRYATHARPIAKRPSRAGAPSAITVEVAVPVVLVREPTIRRQRTQGRVSLGDPSVQSSTTTRSGLGKLHDHEAGLPFEGT